MKHRTLGRTGLSVSEIGLGTEFLLGLPQDDAVGVIREAIDRGINYVEVQNGVRSCLDTLFVID